MINITFDLREPEELYSVYISLKNIEKDILPDDEYFNESVVLEDTLYEFVFDYQYGVLEECRVYRKESDNKNNE